LLSWGPDSCQAEVIVKIDIGNDILWMDSTGKQECVRYVNSDYAGDLDKRRSTTEYLFTFSQAPVS